MVQQVKIEVYMTKTIKILIYLLSITLIVGMVLNINLFNYFNNKEFLKNKSTVETKEICIKTENLSLLQECILKKNSFSVQEYYNLFDKNKNQKYNYPIENELWSIEFFLAYQNCLKTKECKVQNNFAIKNLINCSINNTICALYIYDEDGKELINEIKNSQYLDFYLLNKKEILKQYNKRYKENNLFN